MIRNVVVISDTHFGCAFGLCPPRVKLDEGGYYVSSTLQKKTWAMWRQFWNKFVPEFTKGEPFCLVHLGDCIDGTHHNSVTQISHNIKDQKMIALDVLQPVVQKAERYFHIRGTESRVGASSAHDEDVARQLGAEPDELGNFARYVLWLKMSKKLLHFSHHIGGTGSSSYESTAVYKEMVEAFVEAGRHEKKPPDIIIRGHRHRYFKTEVDGKISIVAPSWQLKTPYVYRIASGRASSPQIGGIVIRAGSNDPLYTRSKVWHVERAPEVVI